VFSIRKVDDLTMKLTIKILFFLCILTVGAKGQTIFWSDDFSPPAGGVNNNNAGVGWLLNTGGSGSNQWYINGSTGQGCPGGGNLLHVSCPGLLCSFLGGPTQPVYNAGVASNRTASSPDISTIGRSGITLSFNWRSRGENNADYGLVRLSNDGGVTWTDLTTRYESNNTCILASIPIPAIYEGISNFRVGFRWINNGNNAGIDPPFTIDNIKLTVPSCIQPSVNAGNNTSICLGDNIVLGGSPTADGTPGPYTYIWTPSATLNNNTLANPTATPITTTIYTVTITDISSSCTANTSVTITVTNVNSTGVFHD
jgi:hypothetical protein